MITGSINSRREAVVPLRLRSVGGVETTVDGTACQFAIYEAEVQWGASWRLILVSAVGSA